MNILFLCTGNSCRSILAEAIFNHLAPKGMVAMSAGSKPKGTIHPRALALLAREGIGTEGYFSKSWGDLPVVPDIVITVCGNAAGETCPAYIGHVTRAHWGVADPDTVIGPEAEIEASFVHAYSVLRKRIEALFALDIRALKANGTFEATLQKIGSL